jgi:hypothetical protein
MIQPAQTNFSGTEFRNKAGGFQGPTQLPYDEAQRSKWQSANRAWWESTPLRYDWREPLTAPVGTKAPAAALKQLLERLTPDAFSRLVTDRLRLGSFLVANTRRAR